jgi:hypothetical protein
MAEKTESAQTTVRNGLEYGIPWDEWIKSFYRFASDL